MKIQIIYEDENILAINKPAGLMVHGDGRSKEPTLVDWILEKYPEMKNVGEPIFISDDESDDQGGKKEISEAIYRPGIVHRLDRETSGVLLIAKNQMSFEFLKKQFQDRQIQKTYKVIVWGHVKDERGTINKQIGRSGNDFRRYLAGRGARGVLREAITQYKVLKRFESDSIKFSLVEVFPKTGRTHQIRVHFKYLNHPVVCDTLYAPEKPCPSLGLNRLALHAEAIEFVLPGAEAKKTKLQSPIPEDFSRAIAEAE